MIYLDNAATTPLVPQVWEAMAVPALTNYGNPSSVHHFGLEAERLIKRSRETLARDLECAPAEVYFTSGATESNNWALESIWHSRHRRGQVILTTACAHASILEKCRALKERGARIIHLPLETSGTVSVGALESALDESVIALALLWVNNETGVVQPVASLLPHVRQRAPHCLVLIDAVQGFLKLEEVRFLEGIDFLSASSHKIGGAKGSGLLAVRSTCPLIPLIYGGGQETRQRGGTENVPGIAGMTAAREWWSPRRDALRRNAGECQVILESRIETEVQGVRINGGQGTRSPFITNLSFSGIRGEVLVHALAECGVIVSTASACSSRKMPVSHVLKALNVPPDFLEGSIRVSFGPQITTEAVHEAVNHMVRLVRTLREVGGGTA